MSGKLRLACCAGFALVIASTQRGAAQGPGFVAPGPDLERLSRRMAEAIRDLADDLATGPGRNPAGQYLEPDARELQTAAANWYATVRSTGDPYQLRRSYSGIDIAWHRLRGQIAGTGLADPAVVQEVRRVEEVDAQVHQALGLNVYPAGNNFNGNFTPGTVPVPVNNGPDEARRLAYAVAQRAEALASAIRSESAVNPALGVRVAEVDQLAQAVDGFYEALNNPATAGQPDFARSNYVPIVRQANALGIALGATGVTPGLRPAWESFAATHNLLRNNLNLSFPTADGLPSGAGQPPPPGYGFAPVPTAGAAAGWAVELDRRVDDLLVHFAPTAGVVPEGRLMLADMERLRQAAEVFRREAARGADPDRLALMFQDVDAHWQRLARRFERIGRGRTGPNIQRVQEIGQICEQVHQALGMPGYPSTFGSN